MKILDRIFGENKESKKTPLPRFETPPLPRKQIFKEMSIVFDDIEKYDREQDSDARNVLINILEDKLRRLYLDTKEKED